ncbi:MAG: hypothetical protein J7619_23165 [Dyadobacter sp.]|uniref:hypothetical protein n=1 Tax=Dyadobacter sp. TaxID=1914288 RepID=UPI001B125426|nr:hypothetical protein [Dyadobacter sp.]MBO9615616.1 hypothetical protein [Dyadobacter sp.]
MESIQGADIIEIGQANPPKAWVVITTCPSRAIAAAFYGRVWAEKLHRMLAESEPPVLIGLDEIPVKVDLYLWQMNEGLIPYSVILENGRALREDTYESEIFNISEPDFQEDHPEIFAGTFWALSIGDAIERAELLWESRRNHQ